MSKPMLAGRHPDMHACCAALGSPWHWHPAMTNWQWLLALPPACNECCAVSDTQWPQFNKEALEKQLLAEHGIQYKWMGKELGGLRKRDKDSNANAGEAMWCSTSLLQLCLNRCRLIRIDDIWLGSQSHSPC
jgi:hypothetical protein